MEQTIPFSHVTHPASICRVFKHRRDYPKLPEGYDWETQKQLYCPRDLLPKRTPGPMKLEHKFGYVFCHRGLYERASGILDNSAAAISNGIREGFFLHEIDAFVLGKLDQAFLAHEKNPRRVTAKTARWESYSFHEILKTALVTRRVETETEFVDPRTEHSKLSSSVQGLDTTSMTRVVQNAPDFASSYLVIPENVPGLLNMFWNERMAPNGRTLQIDLRDEDFAKAIPHYSFHISKRCFQYGGARGAHHTFAWSLFQSTILKGYSKHYQSFDHFHTAIKEQCTEAYGRNFFEINHLHALPPLIMGFFPHDVVALADATAPLDPQSRDRRSYEHIRHTFMNQVLSFVGIGENSYNFILEIVHSGLGLGYDVKTNTAKSPLDGTPLMKQEIIFESLVDRAMIDVSLELRKEYPKLLFSSCTRLPDVITPERKFKAGFATSRLESWKDGEEGLSAQLRAMHGGLYPRSHLVVADDPAAEIAARTWIDQKSDLNRSDLLKTSYNEWLKGAREVETAIQQLNAQGFLPNTSGESLPAGQALAAASNKSSSPTDSEAKIESWFKTILNLGDASGPADGANRFSDCNQSGDDTVEADCDLYHTANEADWEDDVRSQSGDASEGPVTITMAGRRFVFQTEREKQRAALDSAVYTAAEKGNNEVLGNLLSQRANPNASIGLHGSPLAAACANGHRESAELLLKGGASVNGGEKLVSPLELASQYGHSDIVEMLLAVLVRKNAYGSHDTSRKLFTGNALHEASLRGHEAVVRLLLAKGSDVDLPHSASQKTALHTACVWNQINIVKVLLENGAAMDSLPRSRLKPEIVSLVVEAGADIDIQAATQPNPDTSRVRVPRDKFWKRKEKLRKWMQNKDESRRKRIRESIGQPPLRKAPKLPNCGCLICLIDQKIQPALPRARFNWENVSWTHPVSETLRLIKSQSAFESRDESMIKMITNFRRT